MPFVDAPRLKKALEAVQDQLTPEEKKRNTRGSDTLFVRKSHDLYDFVSKVYKQHTQHTKKKNAVDIDTSVSFGIAGRVWCDENVCLEGETFKSPLGRLVTDLPRNEVLAVHYHDPEYDAAFWHSKILEGAIVPEPTLKPGDWEKNNSGNYRPNTGWQNRNNGNYQNRNDPSAANRFIQ